MSFFVPGIAYHTTANTVVITSLCSIRTTVHYDYCCAAVCIDARHKTARRWQQLKAVYIVDVRRRFIVGRLF